MRSVPALLLLMGRLSCNANDAGSDAATPDLSTAVDGGSSMAVDGGSSMAVDASGTGPDGAGGAPEPEGCVRDSTPPELSHLGIDIQTWDGMPGSQAGAIVFDSSLSKHFAPFAVVSESHQNSSLDFVIAKDQNIYAPISGVVSAVEYQTNWWEQDYEIRLRSTSNSAYEIVLDHVSNPLVEVGDPVSAGQVVAETGNWITGGESMPMSNANYGMFELQVTHYAGASCTDYGMQSFVCPLTLMSGTTLSTNSARLSQLMADWEAAKADSTLFDESQMPVPGCLATEY